MATPDEMIKVEKNSKVLFEIHSSKKAYSKKWETKDRGRDL